MTDLVWLAEWFRRHCDGDWEHQYGVSITTLDNPGWSVQIDLAETTLASKAFDRVEIDDGDRWVRVWKEDAPPVLRGVGSPLELPAIVHHMRRWLDQND